MARRDVDHVRTGLVGWVAAGLALLLVLAVAAWQLDWLDRFRDDDAPPPDDPAAVAPPPEVDVPPVRQPRAVAPVADLSPRLDTAAVEAALKPFLRNRNLGPDVVVAVEPLRGGGPGFDFSKSGDTLATPASTTKVVTSAAALSLLGPEHTFETRTVLEEGGGAPRLVLVGGGDPFLLSSPQSRWGTNTAATVAPKKADVVTLARQSAKALRAEGVRRVRLGYDDSLFAGPAVNPHWRSDYIPDDVVPPITALWVDEGRDPVGYGFSSDPSLSAAQVFAAALVKAGIAVVGPPTRTIAGGSAADVASVSSAPLAQIVQRLLEVSDNEAAEVLLRQAGLSQGGDGSSESGRKAVRRVLAANDVALHGSVLYDGSGLSRENLMSPHLLMGVLRWAASDDQPDLRAVLTGLPVAGFTGSLTNRFGHGDPAGAGRVRAKTGTLTGVTSLAGIAVDLDGSVLVFALLADEVDPARSGLAQTALDDAAAALGACHCTR